jgi:hypothetical protein
MPTPDSDVLAQRYSKAIASLKELVPDPARFTTLMMFCDQRRMPGVTAAEAVELVVEQVRDGGIEELLRQAKKPLDRWRFEQGVAAIVHEAMQPFAGRDWGTADTLADIRSTCAAALAPIFPTARARDIAAVLKEEIAPLPRTLAIRTEAIVDRLWGDRDRGFPRG